jgi:hypothetical protein
MGPIMDGECLCHMSSCGFLKNFCLMELVKLLKTCVHVHECMWENTPRNSFYICGQ